MKAIQYIQALFIHIPSYLHQREWEGRCERKVPTTLVPMALISFINTILGACSSTTLNNTLPISVHLQILLISSLPTTRGKVCRGLVHHGLCKQGFPGPWDTVEDDTFGGFDAHFFISSGGLREA